MVSSFDPHNMCAKVERITTKNGCTSCTKWTISFKVQVERITTKTVQTGPSLSKYKLRGLRQKLYKQDHLFQSIFFQLNDLEIGKHYNLNSEKVETWHGIII